MNSQSIPLTYFRHCKDTNTLECLVSFLTALDKLAPEDDFFIMEQINPTLTILNTDTGTSTTFRYSHCQAAPYSGQLQHIYVPTRVNRDTEGLTVRLWGGVRQATVTHNESTNTLTYA